MLWVFVILSPIIFIFLCKILIGILDKVNNGLDKVEQKSKKRKKELELEIEYNKSTHKKIGTSFEEFKGIKEEQAKEEHEQKMKKIEEDLQLYHNLKDSIPDEYYIVTIKNNTLALPLGQYKIWREGETIKLFIVSNSVFVIDGKYHYSFNVKKVSLLERENTEQVVTNTEGGGSYYSLWTGTQKVQDVRTTEKTVGDKRTILYIENKPTDTKIVFDYDDYTVLNRLINK